MLALADQRCFNHSSREAVARCPECSRFFCRECITEHEDRVLCAACLKKSQPSKKLKLSALGSFIKTGQFLFGVVLIWLFFHYLGQALLLLPTSFHDGTIWPSGWWKGQ